MADVTHFRPLDRNQDWALFHADWGLHEADRQAIRALTRPAAQAFWRTHVSADASQRHPVFLPSGHWLHATTEGPNWQDSTPADTAAFLRQMLPLASDETVYFIHMRERMYALPCGVFIAHWHALVIMDDEAPFVFHPATGRYAGFGVHGHCFGGIKPVNGLAGG